MSSHADKLRARWAWQEQCAAAATAAAEEEWRQHEQIRVLAQWLNNLAIKTETPQPEGFLISVKLSPDRLATSRDDQPV